MGKRVWTIILSIILAVAIIGCGAISDKNIEGEYENDDIEDTKEKVLSIDPDPQQKEYSVTLYFKHRFSDYLVPEVRKAIRGQQSLEQLLVEELLKGPSQHDRVSVMPLGLRVLDVTRKGDTTFVNFSREFTEDISLSEVPGKEDTPEEKRLLTEAEMKRLCIYSIVDTLTELEGINQVKFLVENRAISYSDMDGELEKLMFPEINELDEDRLVNTVLIALSRDRTYILTPSKSVDLVFDGLVGEPKWDRIYPLLAKETMGKDSLPAKDDLTSLWSAIVNNIELEKPFISDEEIKPDGRAFVTITYNVSFTSGKKEERQKDKIVVVDEDNIWKVKLPDFISEFR